MRAQSFMQLRWSDLDAYGHVNNVTILELIQEVRLRLLRDVRFDITQGATRDDAETLYFVAHQEVEYLEPIEYSYTTIATDAWITRHGGARIEFAFELWSEDRTVLFARATTTIAVMAASTRRPRRLTDAENEAFARLSDVPLVFRHASSTRRADS